MLIEVEGKKRLRSGEVQCSKSPERFAPAGAFEFWAFLVL
jgi:hypothetical protein